MPLAALTFFWEKNIITVYSSYTNRRRQNRFYTERKDYVCTHQKRSIMKLIINQSDTFTENEIIINCSCMDERLQQLISQIRQFSFTLEGELDGRQYRIPLEQLYYMETVDGKTFLYDKENAYLCRQTLTALEERLRHMTFVRISKSCILNTTYLKCVAPYFNHRLKAQLVSGEELIISRNYIETLKNKLNNQEVSL